MTQLATLFSTSDTDDDEHHTESPTAQLLEDLALFGGRPGPNEPDTRPLPDADAAPAQFTKLFDAFGALLAETRLEDDLPDLLWSLVNVFHRKIDRIERSLDDNERAQQKSQTEQDGSEIRSVELERLIEQGQDLLARRDAYEFFRETAAALFESLIGSAWRPYSGSRVNHRALTASMIDSREFVAARQRTNSQLLIPTGTRVAFTGGIDCNDHRRIWTVLDKVLAKHPGMVLLHGGSPKGAERIAACWADSRKVTQIVFRPDWAKHRNAAPFKRNDQILEALPVGVIAFPGSGIAANLADKARTMGIPVWRFGNEPAHERAGDGAA